jgi:hypothetical protein
MQQLREILSRMKLEFLCEIARDIEDPTYLDFFNTRVDPRLAGSMRGKPREWDMQFVSEAFQLPMEEHGLIS